MKVRILLGLLIVGNFGGNAHAWDGHAILMPGVLYGMPETVKESLARTARLPCADEDQRQYALVARDLNLQQEYQGSKCGGNSRIQLKDVLLGSATDEPDSGMDQDLPDSADPEGYRKFMGGKTGSTSQGFRHMFFGGWDWKHPFTTFQVPIHALGLAPDRAQDFALKAREFFKRRESWAWGARISGWSMHYLQDLAQPFHAVQIPHLQMVPWDSVLQWPPEKGFENLVGETTRTIANYHWAYEGYVANRLALGEAGPFYECLRNPDKFTTFRFNPRVDSPKELALEVHAKSVELAPEIGKGCMALFGTELKESQYELSKGKGNVDYEALATDPRYEEVRNSFHRPTCVALANASMASQLLMQWVMDR